MPRPRLVLLAARVAFSTVALAACAGRCPAAPPAAEPAPSPAERLGTEPLLFIDGSFIESARDVRLNAHPPVRREVVFTFDAPWEGPESAYPTVMKDGGRFRLYYRGGGESTREYACMAESDDGTHWTRPKLGLFEHGGSRDNNIVYAPKEKAYREAHNFAPFKDANPAAPPAQRYKAVALGRVYDPDGTAHPVLNALASPDAVHWNKLRDEPVMTQGSFDSLNVAFWDVRLGKYVCYSRAGRDGKRAIQRSTSGDFLRWSEPQWLEYGGAPAEQFYTNGITPYFRNPLLYVGLPMRFVPERKTVGAERRPVDGVSDAVLISSHDGLNFLRPFMEAYIRPGPDPRNWGNAHGNNTPAAGVVQTSAGEMSVYWAEHYGEPAPRLVRGALRLDGFASANAGHGGGEFTTRPLVLEGQRLVLNYATSAVGTVKAEVRDIAGNVVPGYSLEECEEIYGDELSRPVRWKAHDDLGGVSGKTIRLHFALRDADLYAIHSEP